jgi:hypothetical protein
MFGNMGVIVRPKSNILSKLLIIKVKFIKSCRSFLEDLI